MKDLTFITGNQNKADFLAKHLGVPVAHHKLDLDEIQSLDPRVVVEHKVRQAYEVLNKPVLVPAGIPTSLGSGIMALLAAGIYKTVEEAQAAVCLPFRTVEPDHKAAAAYNQLYSLYRDVYFALGQRDSAAVPLGRVLPELRAIAAEARRGQA